MTRITKRVGPAGAMLLLLAMAGGACNTDEGMTGPGDTRTYNQVQRLGNPLVSEVFLAKRSHETHASIGPAQDDGTIGAELQNFVLTVAGRNQTVATTLRAVLLPDMLIVQTDKATNTAGWLTWALADGWGGRKLTDDVVDAGLSAIFGSLLDPNNVSPALTSDNVPNGNTFLATFPYVGTAN